MAAAKCSKTIQYSSCVLSLSIQCTEIDIALGTKFLLHCLLTSCV